jgi:alkylation response protein AidB-like acyl-CoA dehydrogenase
LIPESLSAELRSMGDAAARFVQERVLPNAEALEQHDLPQVRSLMAEAGAQGFFGCEIPEDYGGLGLPKIAAVVVGNPFSALAGFAVTVLGHASIGTLPLLYFGTEAAKQQFLPRLASGAAIAAYCLSEPGSGSDAQAARAVATPQPDGSYVLNGTKAWVTNAGIADLFTVFAKVRRPDGDKLSAFLVERSFAGVSTGPEERKLGIRSSSTRPLMLDNVAVPSQNLIGDEGEGAKIAFNILNVGRYKMGGATAHAARASLLAAAKYAKDRESFGKPLAAYGAVSEKIGRMAAHVFVAESAAYAVLGLIDNRSAASCTLLGQLKAIEEFSVEASIVKVLGSETLDMAVDETLQIHGGYGYTADLPLERHYRDSRINRIFEGTNEINRLLICSTLLKRALAGKLPLLARAESWRASGWRALEPEPPHQQRLACCARVLQGLAIEMLASAAGHFGMAIEHEQEVLTRCADAQIAAFAAQAANARCVRLARAGHAHASRAAILAQAYAVEALGRVAQQVREVAALVPGLDRKPSLPEWATRESGACIARMRDAAQIVLTDPGYPIA